jgi:LAS superfamily LD-carboxypeptidase LdcB
MKHVAIFENWMREEEIILTSRQGRTIRVKSVHGKIEEIDNEADVRFPFVTGQPITVFMKSWACTNGFKWNGKSPCPEEKVFGIRKKDIPMGHELRMMFPNKFRNESLDSMSLLEISNGAIPNSELTVLNKPTGEKGDPKLRLNSKAAIDFNNMVAAAKLEGVNIEVSQGYRDLGSKERGCADGFTQWCAWNKYKAGTGNLAARPGTSNHGKGSAVDVKNCRKGGAVHNWLKINASKFNFRPLASEAWHWDHSSSRESIISSLDVSNTSSTTSNLTGSDNKSADFIKLPEKIKSSIDKLKTKYGINITQSHIDKEFKQEGDIQPDNGRVDSEAKKNIEKLIKDCKVLNPNVRFPVDIVSDYRSYDDQVDNFGTKAKTRGVDDTQKYNTIPGFSQHHTGKAFDIFSTEPTWWDTNLQVKNWVADNCKKYGFKVTYTTDGVIRKKEPWHLFYVGS